MFSKSYDKRLETLEEINRTAAQLLSSYRTVGGHIRNIEAGIYKEDDMQTFEKSKESARRNFQTMTNCLRDEILYIPVRIATEVQTFVDKCHSTPLTLTHVDL